jgi:hypothetical protein
MKRLLISLGVVLLPTPALAQISAPNAPQGSYGRYDVERMREQIDQNREREEIVGDGSEEGRVNSSGDPLICRRAMPSTSSRLLRARRVCLTAKEWRRRQ